MLLKDHNVVMPVRLEPAAPLSRVNPSTTEPLRSHLNKMHGGVVVVVREGEGGGKRSWKM